MLDWFKKNNLIVDDLIDPEDKNPPVSITKSVLTNPDKIRENAKNQEDEWIWVTGYKGTDKDMCCRGFQYELGKQFDMADDAEIKECESGFHLCLTLTDVYNFYEIKNDHRFFEVKALVRYGDVKNYGSVDYSSAYSIYFASRRNNKLAAKSIEFIRELTADEILYGSVATNWSEEDKKLAISVGVEKATLMRHKNALIEMGYSETFVEYLIDKDKIDVALAVGSQPGLSMDMKVWAIMKD